MAARWTLLIVVAVVSPSPVDGQWISDPGEGWVDLTIFFHDTRETYGFQGERERIFAEGRAVTTSLVLTASLGMVRGLDGWVQLPFHHLRFDDLAGERVSTGPGDPRFFLRAGPELVGLPALPLAVRGGVKLPGGDFEVDAEVIPLGEGQRDWELMVELGRSFHPTPVWTMGWVGHRWRGPNRQTGRDPGDEWFWFWTVGGEAGPVSWQASLEGLRGDAWRVQGVSVPTRAQSLTQVFLLVGHRAGPGEASLGVRVPLEGRNLPAGNALTAKYFLRVAPFGGP